MSKQWKQEGNGAISLKHWKIKLSTQNSIYGENILQKNKGEIKSFPEIQDVKELIIKRRALQEMLRNV